MSAPAMEERAFYTPKELAPIVGLSYKTVLEQIDEGKIPAEKFGTYYKVPAWWVRERQGTPALHVVPEPSVVAPDFGPLAAVLEILGTAMVQAAGALRGAS
jgi:excisionase family DNA binding protein